MPFRPFPTIDPGYESPFGEDDYRHLFTEQDDPRQETLLQPPNIPESACQIEVKRVLKVDQDPVTGETLPEGKVAANVLASRRGNYVWGDAAVFKPTDFELVANIHLFLQKLAALLQTYLSESHYIIQTPEALHFAFAGVTAPCTQKEFLAKKKTQIRYSQSWSNLVHCLQTFLDRDQPSMVFKEIKMNTDGHIVLRMTIEQVQQFVGIKDTLGSLFSENYQRYTDPEKITTLAAVLGVADLNLVDPSIKTQIVTQLNFLFAEFTAAMQGQSFAFNEINWIEYSNRMLQKNDAVGTLVLQHGWVKLKNDPLIDCTLIDPAFYTRISGDMLDDEMSQRKDEMVVRRSETLDLQKSASLLSRYGFMQTMRGISSLPHLSIKQSC